MIFVLGYVVFDEEPREIQMSIRERPMQRSQPILVLRCHVNAVLDEEWCKM